jgi:aminopeptidase N
MKSRVATAVTLLLCASAIVAPAQRLPGVAVPEHYDIHLAPDFATDTFAGRVAISVRLTESARSVTLNAAEIQFHEATIAAGGAAQPATVSLDQKNETATLTVPRELPAGPATLVVSYTGILNDKLRGFYLSRAGNREYAVTQLEATDARRAFPSFDEPGLKATFALSATIDDGDTAISNGRVLSDTPGPGAGKHTLRFATTRRMSTYLVAMVVGNWECISGAADSIPIRICGTPDRKPELGFALEAAEVALRHFNRYFSVRYPFDKLDIVAVPDFAAGAMENTGAIVFRERFLLVGRDGGAAGHRKQVSQYIAHEIAHQWFGDLVTMQWWDDIWLNEGFATWMERRPMEEWKPDWHAALDEVRDTQYAMSTDALRATRPIRTRVETPDEINEVFDAIAYQKTAALIRMVEGYVGPASYRDAINAYLKKFAFGNATGEGLWGTLAAVTKKPVDRIMASYVLQGSMPLLEVRTACAGNVTEVSLSQRPISAAVPPSTTWEIPVCYKRGTSASVDTVACSVLSERSMSVKLDGCSPWVFANAGGRGYYRATYGPEGLRALGEAVRTSLTPVEQTSLLEDVWALVRLNQEAIASYLSLATSVATTTTGSGSHRTASPAVLSVVRHINFVSDRLLDEAARPAFESWVRRTLRPVLAGIGWNTSPQEATVRQELRSAVLYTLGYAGRDPEVLAEARRRVDRFLETSAALDPTTAGTLLQLAAIDGDASLYEQYVGRLAGSSSREQIDFRNALAYFTDPVLQRRVLAYATSAEVRSQDAPDIIVELMQRPWSSRAAWEHVKQNWSALQQSLGVFQGLPQIVRSTQFFCDTASRDDVERFLADHAIRGTERAARQALEIVDRCIATRNEQAKSLAEFLAN